MKSLSLYNRTSTLGGIYFLLLVNRMQMHYFILIMPVYLVHSYMVWGIVVMGLLSQLNLMMMSKWFTSSYAAKGYQGFLQLFGKRAVQVFAILGFLIILLKISIITLGYVEMLHSFIFPSMDKRWLILMILLISLYVASWNGEYIAFCRHRLSLRGLDLSHVYSFFLSTGCKLPRFVSSHTHRMVRTIMARFVVYLVGIFRSGIFGLYGSMVKLQ